MPKKPNTDDGVLVNAAKKIGAAAGKIAALTGAEAPETAGPEATAPKRSKLQKKNKRRLPRREKKAQKKTADSHA